MYVQRVQPANLAAWKNLRPCAPGEPPDVIVRQAPAPQSVFRGVVRPEGMPASDVLQVWVDVGAHPSRGREQADLIRKRVLRRIINGKRVRLTVERVTPTKPDDILKLASQVYEGLSQQDIDEIEDMAHHRSLFDDAR